MTTFKIKYICIVLATILIVSLPLKSEKLFISSKSVDLNVYDMKNITFYENVRVKKNRDRLISDKLIVKMKNGNMDRYIALKNVKFNIYLDDGHYKGSSDKLTYFKEKDSYLFESNVKIFNLATNERVNSDKFLLTKNRDFKLNNKKDEPIELIIDMQNK